MRNKIRSEIIRDKVVGMASMEDKMWEIETDGFGI